MMSYNLNDLPSIWIFVILFMLVLAYTVSNDANSNGENGILWFFIVLLLPMIGLLLYLIIRSTNSNNKRINSRIFNDSNSAGTTPPIVERLITRQPSSNYYTEDLKPKNQKMSEFKFCSNCGSQSISQTLFCKNCGIRLAVGDY